MPESDTPVIVEFDYLEAMGTLAALRAVIGDAPARAIPTKLQDAAYKIARASELSRKGRRGA